MPIHASKTVSVTAGAGTTQSAWIPLNQFAVPFNVGFGVVTNNSGGAVFRVEHTFEDPSAAATIFVHEDVSSNDTNIDGNYAFPVRATRIAVQSVSASANVTFTVLQTGL